MKSPEVSANIGDGVSNVTTVRITDNNMAVGVRAATDGDSDFTGWLLLVIRWGAMTATTLQVSDPFLPGYPKP